MRTYTCSHNSAHVRTVDIDPLGHEWETPNYVWSDDRKTITATRVCKHNTEAGCTETGQVSVTSEVIQPATCYSKGKTKYIPGQFENPAFAVSEVILEDIPMTDHNWVEGDVITPATCSAEGKREVHCTNSGCGAVEERVIPINPEAHNWGEWQETDYNGH